MSVHTVPPSHLSSPSYGYDFVVAVTQGSINATMLQYLSNLSNNSSPAVQLFWTAGPKKGNPVFVTDNTEFLKKVHGIDPFSIPAGTVYEDERVQILEKARFMFAVRVKIGLPDVQDPSTLQNIVTFGNDAITGVGFNLYCSTFDIVELTPAGGWVSTGSWLNISQDPDDPWIYSASVNLKFGSATFTNLPKAVRDKIGSTGVDAFSVQQLLFDLANAGLESSPNLHKTVPHSSAIATALNRAFCGAYFDQMHKAGQPILGYAVTASGHASSASLQARSLDLMVNTYLNPARGNKPAYGSELTTLNYLCSVTPTQPVAVPFTWNWVPDAAAQADHHGVVSINRSWFVNHFSGMLLNYVKSNCYALWVDVSQVKLVMVQYKFSATPGNMPTITKPTSGKTILKYSYSDKAYDQSGLNTGTLGLSTTFTLDVVCDGSTIVITQHLVIHAKASLELNKASANVDKKIVDTYTIAVDGHGNLKAVLGSPTVTDNSGCSEADWFLNIFDDVNSIAHKVQNWAEKVESTSFVDVPIDHIQGFVFPGGKTFAYKGVGFSPSQDLVSFITYVTPPSS